jgi:hypothetical protein
VLTIINDAERFSSLQAPLAYFFLNTVLGRPNSFDELFSLDQTLAKNLRSVKTYDGLLNARKLSFISLLHCKITSSSTKGDVSDLDLTFAVDEERFGQIVTVPLLPGGTARPV